MALNTRKKRIIAIVVFNAFVFTVFPIMVWIFLPEIAGWGMEHEITAPYAVEVIEWLGPRAIRQQIKYNFADKVFKECELAEKDEIYRKKLLSFLGNPNTAINDTDGTTLLHIAASENYFNLLSDLLNIGGKPDAVAWYGTPLEFAIYHGYVECVKVLLEKGANPKTSSTLFNKIYNSLFNVLNEHPPDGNLLFLLAGMTVALDNDTITRIMELLQKYGLDINEANSYHKTPLFYVEDPDFAEIFIQHGANINARDDDGKTVLDFWITVDKSPEYIALLRKHGATGLPPDHLPLRLVAAILSRVRSEIISRSNWAKDRRTFSINRPMDVDVLNCCVTDTKETLWASNTSIILPKSNSDRDSLSTL